MRTNIVLDDKLVARAMRLAGVKTKREVVHSALREFVRNRSRPDVREIFGIGGIDPDYDHKNLRAGK
jgi:Bacterial antitoxin of type II TA system, VapB